MRKLAVSGTLAIAFALAIVASVGAQQPDLRIGVLACNSDPELVVIENGGDASQQLAGWKLVSDPPQSEVFDLRDLGTELVAGASNFIQSGPSASGAFTWGDKFIFRDDDPTDYVRIVDDTGAVIDQVNCGDVVTQPSPTPSPEPSPLADVPNGGGPPPVSDSELSPVMMILLGGSMAAAGLVVITLPWLQLRRSLVAASPSRRRSAAGRFAGRREGQGGSRRSRISALTDMALLGLVAAVALLVVGRRQA